MADEKRTDQWLNCSLMEQLPVLLTLTEKDNSFTTFLTQNEGQRLNMHNECGSEISLDQKTLTSVKLIFKQIYDPWSRVQQKS